jgi:hypothetical protein
VKAHALAVLSWAINLMRRTLIIVSIAIVLLGLGIYFYFVSRSPGIVVAPTGNTTLPTVPGTTQTTTTTSTTNSETSGTSTSTIPNTPKVVSSQLVQITTGPVVPGEALVDLPAVNASSSPDVLVNYIERESGNVFSYQVGTAVLTRISNKTIPGIEQALWLPNAATAFVRYLSGDDFSTINTYALPVSASSTGFFLSQNLADIAVSSTSVLTLASGVNGSSASLVHTDGTGSSQVFSTPLSGLHVSFAGKNQYLAFTKPSATLLGDAFLVNKAGDFSRIAGPLNGLVALASPSGKWVLVSYVLSGSMQMSLINTTTGETLPLPIATIADKCIWTTDESALYCGVPVNPDMSYSYPDDWYQGAVHFSDRVWKINVSGRYVQLVLDFSAQTKTPLDAEAFAVDASSSVLSFVNKNDGSLWSYKF